MKPMMIIPPGTMSQADIKLLRENEICVVVAKNPANVRFVDPIPVVTSRTQIEFAAIQLSRKLLNGQAGFDNFGHTDQSKIANLYINLLVKGTPLDYRPTQEEEEKDIYEEEKYNEIRRLARADAKSQREQKKKEQATTPKNNSK